MLKSLTTLIVALLLVTSSKSAHAFQVVQQKVVAEESETTKGVAVIANFLSVFEEGLLQPSNGLTYSSTNSVRTITLGNPNLISSLQTKINRQTIFQYLDNPLAEVKPSPGMHIFLRVLLIWENNRSPLLIELSLWYTMPLIVHEFHGAIIYYLKKITNGK